MIHIAVDILKLGNLGIQSAAYDAFEILHFASGTPGLSIARVEVEKSEFPALKVRKHAPRELSGASRSIAAVEAAVLGTWNDEVSTRFSLSVSGQTDTLELVLSGRRHHHNFWWRSQFTIRNGEVILHEPALAGDLHS